MRLGNYSQTYNELRVHDGKGKIHTFKEVSPYQHEQCVKAMRHTPNKIWSLLLPHEFHTMYDGCQSCGAALEITQTTPDCIACVTKASAPENEYNNEVKGA